ncbi:hypothetical protein [Microbulbifer hydrolyticus]|uniref:Uncharacterized protein n=1 Tax=Microbulbifer hydrolyticus TaxID=48074 RepID=A0A6P1TA79_9GAMM|nr:hypothetical protein [Microbulbifer hydrolyticus]MBB5212004.1 hypothetical protein [Microbulbifer hydrolyticus]QHQ39688.1 hypothetical protein GTQ55_12285 [Microbulbifer hydrolyticus]
MMYVKMLACIFALSCSVMANAANQGTGKVRITFLENWVSGSGLYIKTDQSTKTNPAGCSNVSSYHLPSESSDLSRSILISAYIAGKPVKLAIYGDGCSVNRPQIVAVGFED